ncbi:hypothetical protein HMPREF1531_00972 [Propionibacterium sp. oral taxon 192 str. F0372]|nr:hypothetical protein HMPREF1531_00972 [Propionibacterium sp. oral taxon 192 str. F0372]
MTHGDQVHSKGERTVYAGPEQLQLRFPFTIKEIHSDNGSEFINHHHRHHHPYTGTQPSHRARGLGPISSLTPTSGSRLNGGGLLASDPFLLRFATLKN